MPDNLKYVVSLAKKLTNEIGFVPDTRYAAAEAAGRLHVQTLNDEPCGFIVHGPPKKGYVHIWQTAVQVDARRRAAATAMLDSLKLNARLKNAHTILLRCRSDLQSNEFWQASGFLRYATSPAGRCRGGLIYHYALKLPTKQTLLFPEGFEEWPTQPPRILVQTAASRPQSSPSSKRLLFLSMSESTR